MPRITEEELLFIGQHIRYDTICKQSRPRVGEKKSALDNISELVLLQLTWIELTGMEPPSNRQDISYGSSVFAKNHR